MVAKTNISKEKSLKRKAKQTRSNEKKRRKKEIEEVPENEVENCPGKNIPVVRNSDDIIPRKVKWTNKQRVLVFASRGITYRDRHLMEDIKTLLPHSKSDVKREKKEDLVSINEIAEMKNCNKCIYFENKKHQDLYMWMSNITKGPSIKFMVENVHSMKELKLTGNSLKGTRPLLCFDPLFDKNPQNSLMKELFKQVFNAPHGHPKTQPFFDRVFVFSLVDNKVWFRNYQIVDEEGQLTEIGPRFVLNPIKIFNGSFSGEVIWSNHKYVTPNQLRHDQKVTDAVNNQRKYAEAKRRIERGKPGQFIGDTTTDFFETKGPEEAKGREKDLFFRRNGGKKRAKGKRGKGGKVKNGFSEDH